MAVVLCRSHADATTMPIIPPHNLPVHAAVPAQRGRNGAITAITGAALIASVALILYTLFLTTFTAGDLAIFQRAAVRWMSGIDPYGVAPPLTPGGPPGSDYGYPLPALYFILPLTPLPLAVAATLHSQLSILAIMATPFAWLRRRRSNRTSALAG
ncbi:MAG TPA: hypothetical protein VGJ87_02095, partial [Roseiflexaceae bacterium]